MPLAKSPGIIQKHCPGQHKGDFSLSVKIYDSKQEGFAFKHYLIRHNNERFYITDSSDFSTFFILVQCFHLVSRVCTRFFNLPPYTAAGFDLTTHSSNLFGGRLRRYQRVVF
jgi:hypothetical protein